MDNNYDQVDDDVDQIQPMQYDYADDEEIESTKYSANDIIYDLQKNLEFSVDAQIPCIQLKQDETQSIKARIAMKTKDSDQRAKSGVDLICVIDRSGSMYDDGKLEMVKKTMKLLLNKLTGKDRLCIVQFDHEGQRLTPLLRASPQNRIKFEQAIDSLEDGGGTKISRGTRIAFDQIKNRKYRNEVTSIFLLSDGQDDNAAEEVKQQLKQFDEPFSIHSFGYGADNDAKMMTSICSLKNGGYYLILDYTYLDEYFVNALGGLVSVVGQNIKIQVKLTAYPPFNGIKITKMNGKMWEKLNDCNYRIKIPQISQGNTKAFVFELTIPKYDAQMGNLPKVVQVIDATLELKSIYTNEIVKKQSTLNLTFVEKEQINQGRQQSEVDEEINRVNATETIELAIEDCEHQEFKEAQVKLDNTIADIKRRRNLTLISKRIKKDLKQAKQAALPDNFYKFGRNQMYQFVSNNYAHSGINARINEDGKQNHEEANEQDLNQVQIEMGQQLQLEKNEEIQQNFGVDLIDNRQIQEESSEEAIEDLLEVPIEGLFDYKQIQEESSEVPIEGLFDNKYIQEESSEVPIEGLFENKQIQEESSEVQTEDLNENDKIQEEPSDDLIESMKTQEEPSEEKSEKISKALFKDLLLTVIVACCCYIFGIVQLFFGIIYPLKMTFNSYFQKEKQSLWINYWILMSLFYIIESINFDVPFMIPFYQEIKTLFAVWLYYEKFQGALSIGAMAKPIYKLLTPILVGFQDKINLIEKKQQEKQEKQEKENTQ